MHEQEHEHEHERGHEHSQIPKYLEKKSSKTLMKINIFQLFRSTLYQANYLTFHKYENFKNQLRAVKTGLEIHSMHD